MVDLPGWMARAASGAATHDDAGRASHALRRYFRGVGGAPAYSGADFATFGDNPRNHVVADDLIAVAMLNGKVRQHAPRRLLETDRDAISDLLAEVPADLDLASADSGHISRGSCAWQLWDRVRRGGRGWGVGEVAASKLLARKRPRLLPVWDDRVRRQWSLDNSNEHWQVTWTYLHENPDAVEFLSTVRRTADISEVSTLRGLDVLLWMSSPTKELPPVERPTPRTEDTRGTIER